MALIRVMPPADGLRTSIVVNGRSYSCALGSTIDVPDFDATVMMHNGWTSAGTGASAAPVGATTSRPAKPNKNDHFVDATLGYVIVFDGKVWRNPVTGAAV